MKLIQILRRESNIPFSFFVFVISISGLSNSFLLSTLSIVARNSSQETSNYLYLLLFTIAIIIFISSQRYILVKTSEHVEEALHKVRQRIVAKILDAELLVLEKVGRAEIYASISKETKMISEATMNMVMMCQAVVLIFFTLLYIGWLSLIAFAIFLAFTIVSAIIFQQRIKRIEEAVSKSLACENELFATLTHLLDGFKEVRMSEKRRTDLVEHLEEISASVISLKYDYKNLSAIVSIYFQTSFYLLIGAQVFLLPLLTAMRSEDMGELTTTVLFLIGPIAILIGGTNLYASATVAANNIETLEASITQHNRATSKRKAAPLVFDEAPFREITFEQVEFSYPDKTGDSNFAFGPLDLSISPGQVTFISGGNGSGKSTFLRLLTCLYFPTAGDVKLDGQRLGESNANVYRSLFSVIFYDYHLFKRLYGIRNINHKQVEELLIRLQLDNKTRLIDNKFEAMDLSSGQRRRLSLIINYLEKKPICVFDEWAAEQDPDFRRYFYTNILPELKSQGKTIIAVTHDDQYYDMDYIDQFLKFEEGRLVVTTE